MDSPVVPSIWSSFCVLEGYCSVNGRINPAIHLKNLRFQMNWPVSFLRHLSEYGRNGLRGGKLGAGEKAG